MSDDIETMLRHADAPAMGVSAQEIIAGAQRTRRRRRARYGAYGLAAALVIGVGVGADRVVANRAHLAPAGQSTTGPLGALFKDARIGNARFNQYTVVGTAGDLGVVPDDSSSPLHRTQHLDGGVSVFRDGQHTVVVTPLPRAADRASVVFTNDATTSDGESLRVNSALTVQVSVTESPATVRGVIWSSGAGYYSTTGERPQVASFSDSHVFCYPRLGVLGLDDAVGTETRRGSLPAAVLAFADASGGRLVGRFVAAVPHGARNVSAQTVTGYTSSQVQVRRLGTTSYDLIYVTAVSKDPNSYSSLVRDFSWTDGSGRHTRSYS